MILLLINKKKFQLKKNDYIQFNYIYSYLLYMTKYIIFKLLSIYFIQFNILIEMILIN